MRLNTLQICLHQPSIQGILAAADSAGVLQALEDRCNEEIQAARPVQATVLHREDSDHPLLQSQHLRGGLPSWEAVPELRLLHIQDLDVNACGGTHLANTAELQVVKLLGTENARGGTRLWFLVGGRALAALSGAALHETALNKVGAGMPP